MFAQEGVHVIYGLPLTACLLDLRLLLLQIPCVLSPLPDRLLNAELPSSTCLLGVKMLPNIMHAETLNLVLKPLSGCYTLSCPLPHVCWA